MKENDDMTAIEVYDLVKPQGPLEVPVRVFTFNCLFQRSYQEQKSW